MAVSRRYICKGCFYSFDYGGGWGCAYSVITNTRRPCPSGPGCSVRKGEPEPELLPEPTPKQRQKKAAPPPRTASWDVDKAMAMYEQGESLKDIAQAVGVDRNRVRVFFSNHGLKFPDTRKTHKWDVERAAEMRRQGATFDEIAEAVGSSKTAVHHYLQEQGIKPQRGVPEDELPHRIAQLCEQGKGVTEIASEMRVSGYLVHKYLEQLGLKARDKRKKAPDA